MRITGTAASLAFLTGLLLFYQGFLLTRVEDLGKSSCDDIPASPDRIRAYAAAFAPNHDWEIALQAAPQRCWVTLQAPKRLVMVLVDALRYDFAESLSAMQETETSALLRFIADAPTTTLQRITALSTGGIPAFSDLQHTFDGSAIREDTLIHQLREQQKSIVFMGDDTWLRLFSELRFLRAYGYPSFDAWDLDTVDFGVLDHLDPELGQHDWDVMIAHLLGVDHAGHRYHAHHPAIQRKLALMDSIVAQVLQRVHNDTLVVVFGDHGMNSEGEHGGNSDLETHAALFVSQESTVMNLPRGTAVYQVDLVPTLALLQHAAIPYTNLGTILPIPSLFGGLGPYVDALRVNAWQMQHFFTTLVESAALHGLEQEEQQQILRHILHLEQRYGQVTTDEEKMSLAKEYRSHMAAIASLCRERWTSVDVVTAWVGVIVCLLSLFVPLHQIIHMYEDPMDAAIVGILSSIVVYGAFSYHCIKHEQNVTYFCIVACLCYLGFRSISKSLSCKQMLLVFAPLAVVLAMAARHSIAPIRSGAALSMAGASYSCLCMTLLLHLTLRCTVSITRDMASVCSEAMSCFLLVVYWYQLNSTRIEQGTTHHWIACCVIALICFDFVLALRFLHKDIVRGIDALYFALFPLLALVLGPGFPVLGVLTTLFSSSLSFPRMHSDYPPLVLFSVFGVYLFFITGHEADISSLHIKSSFVGSASFHFLRNGFFLMINTMSGPILALVAYMRHSHGNPLHLLLFYQLRAVLAAINLLTNQGHVLLWSFFAPKFLFDAVTVACLTLCCIPFRHEQKLKFE